MNKESLKLRPLKEPLKRSSNTVSERRGRLRFLPQDQETWDIIAITGAGLVTFGVLVGGGECVNRLSIIFNLP